MLRYLTTGVICDIVMLHHTDRSPALSSSHNFQLMQFLVIYKMLQWSIIEAFVKIVAHVVALMLISC